MLQHQPEASDTTPHGKGRPVNQSSQPDRDLQVTFCREAIADAAVYLAMWGNRGDQPTAAERAAASAALDRLDVTLQRLHRLRGDLAAEIRRVGQDEDPS